MSKSSITIYTTQLKKRDWVIMVIQHGFEFKKRYGLSLRQQLLMRGGRRQNNDVAYTFVHVKTSALSVQWQNGCSTSCCQLSLVLTSSSFWKLCIRLVTAFQGWESMTHHQGKIELKMSCTPCPFYTQMNGNYSLNRKSPISAGSLSSQKLPLTTCSGFEFQSINQ